MTCNLKYPCSLPVDKDLVKMFAFMHMRVSFVSLIVLFFVSVFIFFWVSTRQESLYLKHHPVHPENSIAGIDNATLQI